MYAKYKRDMERQHGIKFKENVKLDPYNSQRTSKILKGDIVGSSDTISQDSATKLI